MPYDYVKMPDGWHIKNTETGQIKNKKPCPTKPACAPYMRALYAAEDGALHPPPKKGSK